VDAGAQPLSDRELLARHVAGDHDAFGEIVRRHRDRLWAVALRTLGDREDAADAVQDAFVSAFRSAHTYRGQAAVTTWLHRITVNACLDRLRKAESRRTSPVPDSERFEELLDPEESPEAPAERGELHSELIAAMTTLPADQRAALVLVDMQGYPVAEAAEILGVPTGTVKSRCARGRARLLPLLSHLRTESAKHHSATMDNAAASGGRNRAEGASVTATGAHRTQRPADQDGGGER
jgi:RNA polymerase sigma-70 factor, ECF subfamily